MKQQGGFGVIAAIVVLVLLATLAAAIVALSTTQSLVLAQDVLSARAMQTARAGTEWGLSRAFSTANPGNPTASWCDAANAGAPVTATVDTSAINGFQATVTCWSTAYNEGEVTPGVARAVRLYQILAVACPAAPCPQIGAATAGPAYVERRREAVGM